MYSNTSSFWYNFFFFPFKSFVIIVIKVMTCRKAQEGFSRKVKAPVILLDI